MYCIKCGNDIGDSVFCSKCGYMADVTDKDESFHTQQEKQNAFNYNENAIKNKNTIDKMTEKLNNLVGGEGPVKLHVSDLFVDVFKKHTHEESEKILTYGTKETTPSLSSIDSSWPKPWLYSRIFLVFLAAFAFLLLCCSMFHNLTSLPGVIFLGSFMLPMTLMFMFYEMNVAHNISFFSVLKVFLIGGCASLFASLILFSVFDYEKTGFISAIVTGIVEEIGKGAIVYAVIKSEKQSNHRLNGLLIGACVGAGFAAFESAGYAFTYYLNFGYDMMMDTIAIRAFLSPGGHIAWAAITGFAIMMVKGEQPLSMNMLKSKHFITLFAIPIALHAIWDMPIRLLFDCFLQVMLTVISWIVLLVLISSSLNELSKKIEQARNDEVAQIQ